MTRDRKIGRIGKRYNPDNKTGQENLYTLENINEGSFYPSERYEVDRKLFTIYRNNNYPDSNTINWIEEKISGSAFTKFRPQRIFLMYKIIKDNNVESLVNVIQERMKMYILKNIFNPKIIKAIIKVWKKLNINYGKLIGEVRYILTYCKRQSLLDQLNKYLFDQDSEFLVYDKEKCSILAKKLVSMNL
jgi:hypothetical protein